MHAQESKQKITLLVPSPLVSQLKQVAKRHQRSFTGEVIWALQQYLQHIETQEQHEQKK
jgi:hypothetical protein